MGTQGIALRKAVLLQSGFEIFAFGVSDHGVPLSTGSITFVDYEAGRISSVRGSWSVLDWAEPEFDLTKYAVFRLSDTRRIYRYGADKWQRDRDPFCLPRAGYLYVEPWRLIASGGDLYIIGFARQSENSPKSRPLVDRVYYFNLVHKLAVSIKDGCHYRLTPYDPDEALDRCYLKMFSFNRVHDTSPYVLAQHELAAL